MIEKKTLSFGNIPAALWGAKSDKIFFFLHGKCGNKEEGERFAEIACPSGWQVLGIDLPEHGERANDAFPLTPWNVVPELRRVMAFLEENWPRVAVRANSIGAWFSMLSFAKEPLDRCLFVSPILDMEVLIEHMMQWAGVSEERLRAEREISTEFGETLSWEYLEYTKVHRIQSWSIPTSILYAGRDNLTDRRTVDDFVRQWNAKLTVMEDGEHWFHTPEQLDVLRGWEERAVL